MFACKFQCALATEEQDDKGLACPQNSFRTKPKLFFRLTTGAAVEKHLAQIYVISLPSHRPNPVT